MNDDEEIIYAMRIAKEKIEELRTQIATNHERAEGIIRAREATIARQASQIARLELLLKQADESLDGYGLGRVGSPLRCAIRDELSLPNDLLSEPTKKAKQSAGSSGNCN